MRCSIARPGEHRFAYMLSSVVADNLLSMQDVSSLDLTTFDVRPGSPWAGRSTRSAMLGIERRFQPDAVYTVFGPTYVRFRSPHLLGFAVPWVTHPNPHAWRAYPGLLARVRHRAWCRYVAFWTRLADQWVLETAVAADGLARVLGVARDRFHVVPNTYSEPYARARAAGVAPDRRMARENPTDVHLLVFSHWYPHKNLELVPAVAAELRRRDPARRYRFFLTFDTSSDPWSRIREDARRRAVEDRVINLGPILVGDGPGLYAAADALFLPTLLETYTATYPEAMCIRRPIVTTDLPFARDLCHDAALYFAPNDAAGAAERILELSENGAVRDGLVTRGEAVLATGIEPEEAYRRVVGILESMVRGRGRESTR